MKNLFAILFVLMLCGCQTLPPPGSPAVIGIGASVAGGFGEWSRPALRVAEKLGVPEYTMSTIGAQGGAVRNLRWYDAELFGRGQLVVSLDAFFWDSYRDAPCQEEREAVRAILGAARAAGVAIALGNVPDIKVNPLLALFALASSPRQGCRADINAELAQACRLYDRCALIDLDALVGQIRADGLWLDGKHYTEGQLFTDGLHINGTLSEIIARQIVERVRPLLHGVEQRRLSPGAIQVQR